MVAVRVLADDLTGALDCAARFIALTGSMPVFWRPPQSLPVLDRSSAAVDAGTREMEEATARQVNRGLAGLLCDADIAFKKLDSLLRGSPAAEISACLRFFDHCVIAPAFPYQGRVTRNGRQLVKLQGEAWRDCGVDLAAGLNAFGITVSPRRSGKGAVPGVSLWDAETEADLLAVVDATRELPGSVLWCGSGGLAGALAGAIAPPPPPLPRPILALIGSDHPASVAQLSAAWAHVLRIRRGDDDEVAPVARRLGRGAAAVTITLPPGLERGIARRQIAEGFAALLERIEPPGTLVIAGGETLRDVCDALGVDYLEVDGEVVPGVPTSVLNGGRWDGVTVVSKSGAFGDAGLLVRLLGGR